MAVDSQRLQGDPGSGRLRCRYILKIATRSCIMFQGVNAASTLYGVFDARLKCMCPTLGWRTQETQAIDEPIELSNGSLNSLGTEFNIGPNCRSPRNS